MVKKRIVLPPFKNISLGIKITLSYFFIIFSAAFIGYFLIGNLARNAIQEDIGNSSSLLAQETVDKIDRTIQARSEMLEAFSRGPGLQEAVIASNVAFDGFDNASEYIMEQDENWIATPPHTTTVVMRELLDSAVSNELREVFVSGSKGKDYGMFREVFVTNRYGANAAQTGRTSDYYQADEMWWQDAKRDSISISNIGYDESAGVHSIDIGIRVDDPDGNFIGVIKAVMDIKSIFTVLEDIEGYTGDAGLTQKFILVTQDGHVVYSTSGTFGFLEDVSEEEFMRSILAPGHDYKKERYLVTQEGGAGGGRQLFVHAHSRKRGNEPASGWTLFSVYEVNEIFASSILLNRYILAIVIGAILLFLFIGFFMARAIIRPIQRLTQTARQVAGGDWDVRAHAEAGDEIGELARTFNQMLDSLLGQEILRREIIDTLPAALIITDGMGTIQTVNPGVTRILGHTVEELAGKPISMLFSHERDNDSQDSAWILDNIKKGPINNRFISMEARNGKDIPVSINVRTLSSSQILFVALDRRAAQQYAKKRLSELTPTLQNIATGDFSANIKVPEKEDEFTELFVALALVVEDLREYNQSRIEALAEKEVYKTKAEFSSVFAHELKSPLAGIKLVLETLLTEGGKLNKTQKDYLREIYSSVDRQLQLVNDMLNVSRAETGTLEVKFLPTDLELFIADVIASIEAQATENKCDIAFKKSKSGISKLLIDQDLTRQILYNLLANAIRYSKKGTCRISVTLSVPTKGTKEGRVIISVADSGIGIPKKEQAKVFEKFFRAENAVKHDARGTGLGMYIVKIIAEKLGGKIWFESEEGKGTTFYLELPVNQPPKGESAKHSA